MATSKTTKSTSKPKQPQWIAERRLERRDGVGGIVIVRIGSPEWPPGAKEWRCPFMFEGLGDDSIHFGKSIDSMAALQNALIGIRELLERTGIPLRFASVTNVARRSVKHEKSRKPNDWTRDPTKHLSLSSVAMAQCAAALEASERLRNEPISPCGSVRFMFLPWSDSLSKAD